MKYSLCLLVSILLLQTFGITTTTTTKTSDASPDSYSFTDVLSQQKEKASPTHSANYEAHANQMLNAAAERMQSIWNRKREMFLNITKSRLYSAINQGPLKQQIDDEYRSLAYDLALNLSVIPVKELQSPILRRQVKRLSKLQFLGLSDMEYTKMRDTLHTMQTFITTGHVCLMGSNCSQKVRMLPGISKIVMRAKKLSELEYYWTTWRDELKSTAKTAFIKYLNLMRAAANYNGHVTPSRTWYLYYETPQFLSELEDVVWEIMPLYQELHAYLRNSSRATYDTPEDDDGAIPAHVIEQMIMQAWYPFPSFRTPYPNSHLPSVHKRLVQVLTTSMQINHKSAEFFESLGLHHMSDAFYEKFSRRMGNEELDYECRSEVFNFPPDVALRYCPKLDYKKMLQMHGSMAELQYNIYKQGLPFGLDREPCPGFGSAISESAVIASGTPRHLNRMGILATHNLTSNESMNRIFRMGVHTILAIPQYFVNEKFLVDALDRRIDANKYNCDYWRLQYKYAGVVPPKERNEDTFDPDFKFYRGLNPENSNTVKLLSEILGYQFYRAFCLVSGQYKPGSVEFPLHNCDFHGNTTAGDLMKSMMKLGATKNWRDVMEIATGERKLSGKGIMEYYAPLFTWLKEQNKQHAREPGWDANIKCGGD